jgi:hypothetical protein
MKRFVLTLALAATAACTSNNPIVPDDGGHNDGGNVDGGSDAGHDAGSLPNPDLCGGALSSCDAGSECLLQQLEDGGRGRRCSPGDCSIVAQDCDGGLKCDYRDGGRTCVSDGTLAEGADCLGNGFACIKGTVCTSLPAADGGTDTRCTKYCEATANCTSPQQCLLTLVLNDSLERPQVCADPPPTCDLLLQTCPATGDACYPNGATGSCFAVGATPNASPCAYSNDCGKGATCVNTAGGSTCRQMCAYPSGAPDCDGGTCAKLSGALGVGVCL